MTSVWGSIELPPKEVARTNRVTRAAILIAVAGFLVVGFFFLVWVQVVPPKGVLSGRSFIGLSLTNHPKLFSGFNLGAWPTLVFGIVLLCASFVSVVRPSRLLAWTSFTSLLVISGNILWQGIGRSPKELGFPAADNVRYGGSVGLLISALAGLVISWYYARRFRKATQSEVVVASQQANPDLPYAPEDPRGRMSTAAKVGASLLGGFIAVALLLQLIYVTVHNSR